MAMTSSHSKSPAPEINVTPLVDVVLVLLIIFMVVVPMLSKELLVQLPEKAKPSDDTSESVNLDPPYVVVHGNGIVDIDAKTVALTDVPGVIRSRLNRDRTVRFKSEDDAPYSLVVDVLDAVKGAGGTNVTVETLKTSAQAP